MTPHINFVLSSISEWQDIALDPFNISSHEFASRLRMGRDVWIVQTFQYLRNERFKVGLNKDFDQKAINIAHCEDIPPRHDLWKYFIVSVRADRDPAFISNIEIVQNKSSIWSNKDIYIPHWPQPALIKRDPSREATVQNIVYMGNEVNLDKSFRSRMFKDRLAAMDMKLFMNNDWFNYKDADVVLAVRNGYPLYISSKPASKVVNAWRAGCPAIVSCENGYREIQVSALDFLEARSHEDVLYHLKKLKENSQLYYMMVNNGFKRAKEFTFPIIVDRWIDVLDHVIFPEFYKFSKKNKLHLLKKSNYKLSLARKRIWGTQIIPKHRSCMWRKILRPIRRVISLPGSICIYSNNIKFDILSHKRNADK